MSRRTPTSTRLVAAVGAMYHEVSKMETVGHVEAGAQDEALGILRTLLNSPHFLERLAKKMDEVK